MRYHLNGELVPAGEATVSVRDRGFRHGDAATETVRTYGGEPFRWRHHADRLAESCDRLGIDHGLDRAELRSRVEATLAANDLPDARVRLSVSRGADSGGIDPPDDPDPTVLVTASPLPRGGVDGGRAWDGPATLQTAETRHIPDRAVPAGARTHNRLDAVLARRELVGRADEALVRDGAGDVVGTTTASVFFVSDDALRTPSLDGPVLPRVARRTVLELAEAESLPVRSGRYAPADVRNAEEAFLASAAREIQPVGVVDGIDVGGGPVTTLLSRLVDERTEALYGD